MLQYRVSFIKVHELEEHLNTHVKHQWDVVKISEPVCTSNSVGDDRSHSVLVVLSKERSLPDHG